MTEAQILSKIINTKNIDIIVKNNLTEEFFPNFQEEYNFIVNHHLKYNKVPDIETFLDKFIDFDIVNTLESDEYLINALKEEYQYSQLVPVVNKVADLLQTNAYDALEYLQSVLPQLDYREKIIGKNIVKEANERYEEYLQRVDNPNIKLLSTGFRELDDIVGGLNRGEEFVVIVARTGEGKTWILLKMLEYSWSNKLRVGLIEPEMSYNKIGYRFDTLNGNISNTALLRGKDNIEYKRYIDKLKKSKVPFIVATPKDFGRSITVSKLRNFCKDNKLDILGIDGISYLRDERGKKTDNKTTTLTNISEDLMDLSIELGIPIITVVQSNRTGAGTDNSPELESIRDSDGIAYNASMVISVKQKEPGVELTVKKNRNGTGGGCVIYAWDIDKGNFIYVPSTDDSIDNSETIKTQRNRFRDRSDNF